MRLLAHAKCWMAAAVTGAYTLWGSKELQAGGEGLLALLPLCVCQEVRPVMLHGPGVADTPACAAVACQPSLQPVCTNRY